MGNSKEKLPLVSIIVLAYNHELFIGECLNSVFSQKCDFGIELIIGEDFSGDQTLAVIDSLIKNQTIEVNVIRSNENVGLIKNYTRCIRAAKGKYIVVLSGDDYWIDDYKVARQVSFLEENLDCGLVYTNYNVLNNTTKKITTNYLDSISAKTFTGNCRDELIKGIPAIMNITTCIRREILTEEYFNFIDDDKFLAEDFPTFMWVGFDSKICYQNDITTVYRVNDKSLTNSMSIKKKWEFAFSHIYMREKFLKLKDSYIPVNHHEINVYEYKNILKFGFKSFTGKEYVNSAYKFLKKHKVATVSEKLMFFSMQSRLLNFFLRLVFFINNRLIESKSIHHNPNT
jgi:glycosyltransferase involved in cell wall biosynthesis